MPLAPGILTGMEALATVLGILLILGLVTMAVILIAALLGARALSKRNRVSPDTPTAAPTSWLGAPGAGARLHRRLRNAVAVARAAATTPTANPQLADIARDLEAEAVALDGHIVVTARMPAKTRRAHQAALTQRVQAVERLASQLSVESAQSQAPRVAAGQHSALDALAEQLDTLEAARQEVTRLETEAGVDRASPYAVPDRPGAPPSPGTPRPGT